MAVWLRRFSARLLVERWLRSPHQSGEIRIFSADNGRTVGFLRLPLFPARLLLSLLNLPGSLTIALFERWFAWPSDRNLLRRVFRLASKTVAWLLSTPTR